VSCGQLCQSWQCVDAIDELVMDVVMQKKENVVMQMATCGFESVEDLD